MASSHQHNSFGGSAKNNNKKNSLHRFIRSNELDARRFQPSPLRSHSVEIRVNTVFCTWSRITLPPECQDLCQVCIIASKQKPVCRELDYWPALEPVVQNIYNGAVGVMHAATVHWPTQTGQSHTQHTKENMKAQPNVWHSGNHRATKLTFRKAHTRTHTHASLSSAAPSHYHLQAANLSSGNREKKSPHAPTLHPLQSETFKNIRHPL